MDEKSLSDQISHLMNDTTEVDDGPVEADADEQKDILVESLKAVAGQSDGALETALDEFLSGKGVLHETTRTALTRGGDTGLGDVITLLTKQFKLSPVVAKLIASLIMKMQSSASKDTEKEAAAKKKPRRKAKPKTASSAKKEARSAKKAKKKTTAKPKKPAAKKKPSSKTRPSSTKKTKRTASKPAAKKTPTAKTSPKKATAKAKPKKSARTSSVEVS
jgi:hypothetical protein